MRLAATEITGGITGRVHVADQRPQLFEFGGCGCFEIRVSPVSEVFAHQRASRIASALPAGPTHDQRTELIEATDSAAVSESNRELGC